MATNIRRKKIFKRMGVEESLSGSATQAQLSRRYDIYPQLIIRRCMDYTAGKLARDNDPDLLVGDARIRELERVVGKLVPENELLKSERRSWKPGKRELIARHRAELGCVQAERARMELPGSSYYYSPVTARRILNRMPICWIASSGKLIKSETILSSSQEINTIITGPNERLWRLIGRRFIHSPQN